MDRVWAEFVANKSAVTGHELCVEGSVIGTITEIGDHRNMCMHFIDLHVRTPEGKQTVYSVNAEIAARHPRRSKDGIELPFTKRDWRYIPMIQGMVLPN